MRIEEGSAPIVRRGDPFEIEVDGDHARAYPGETVAIVLLAAEKSAFRTSRIEGEPRSLFCGIGVCYDCLVTIDGLAGVRACMTKAQPGMKVSTQHGVGEEL